LKGSALIDLSDLLADIRKRFFMSVAKIMFRFPFCIFRREGLCMIDLLAHFSFKVGSPFCYSLESVNWGSFLMAKLIDIFIDFDFFLCNEDIFLGSWLHFGEGWVCLAIDVFGLVSSLEGRLVFFGQALWIGFAILFEIGRVLVSNQFLFEVFYLFVSLLERIIVKFQIRVVWCSNFGKLLKWFWRC
jgi:hypothetical protein